MTDIDKTDWPSGPWDDEPDKLHWIDEDTDLDCLIVRQPYGGHLCGYVGLPPSHPLHGVDYDAVKPHPVVHGGLTYADACDENGRICHTPEGDRPDEVWWLGFDCAHSGDKSPGYVGRYEEVYGLVYPNVYGPETYKTVDYVRNECRKLAAQLAKADM